MEMVKMKTGKVPSNDAHSEGYLLGAKRMKISLGSFKKGALDDHLE